MNKNHCFIHPKAKIGRNFVCGLFVIIEDDVTIGDDVVFGDYVKVSRNCTLGNGVRFGDYVKLMPGTVLGDNVRLDDYCNTSGYCSVGNNVIVKRQTMIGQATTVENDVWIGSNVTTNRLKYPVMDKKAEKEEGVVIKTRCVIGSKALILAGVTLNEGSWVSTGGVVTKDTEAHFIYIGNPARKVRPVPAEFVIKADTENN